MSGFGVGGVHEPCGTLRTSSTTTIRRVGRTALLRSGLSPVLGGALSRSRDNHSPADCVSQYGIHHRTFILPSLVGYGVHVRDIDHLNLYIPADGVERALSFYRDLLGFGTENVEAYRAGERSLFTFRAGDGVIHVMPDEAFEPPGRNYNHVAVGVDADEPTLRDELAAAGVEIDRERERRNRPGADVAIYVSDPFGYGVELRPER